MPKKTGKRNSEISSHINLWHQSVPITSTDIQEPQRNPFEQCAPWFDNHSPRNSKEFRDTSFF